ncbi:DUF2975 domain-containing protein [Companilactobacillus muriivasis]|uniref:DUF2975 domain-containing protein n=1 Tax=Companilactobacillus muriivasis TaxID=3081444 RepID=UPI0030C75FF8
MKILTNYLRAILILLAALLVLIFIYLFPDFITAGSYAHINIFIKIYFGTGLYLSGILSYLIIWFTWRLLQLADKKAIFTANGVHALKRIKQLFYTIAPIYIVLAPAFKLMNSNDDSPIGILLDAFLIMLALMLGVFVNVLQLVVQKRTANYKQKPSLKYDNN